MAEEKPSARDTVKSVFAEMAEYYEELEGESSRAAAILAVASLEDELESLLRAQFPKEISNGLWKKIAGPGFTPLGSLKARADVAQAFGFYGPKTRKLIEQISLVRNKFAHSATIREFNHPVVLAECKKLADNPLFPFSCDDDSPELHIRWGFVHTVQSLTVRLLRIKEYEPDLGDMEPMPLP